MNPGKNTIPPPLNHDEDNNLYEGDNVLDRTLHLGIPVGRVPPYAVVMGDPERIDILLEQSDSWRDLGLKRGYRGVVIRRNDVEIGVFSHGIGGPSASIVFEELVKAGVETIVRIGTCGGLREDVVPGKVIVASASGVRKTGCATNMYADDNYPPMAPDPLLASKIYWSLRKKGIDALIGPVFSSDAFYAEAPDLARDLARLGYIGIDMETAILYYLSWMRHYRSTSILIVSNNLVVDTDKYLSNQDMIDTIRRIFESIVDVLAGEEA